MATLIINDGQPYIEDIWDYSDFVDVANDNFQDVNFSEAMIVKAMRYVSDHYDCNTGITWDVVTNALEEVLK